MNEIEKMYENAGIEKFEPKEKFSLDDCEEYCLDNNCKECSWRKYPPFTAEKQLELIKWLSTKELKIRTNKQPYAVYIGVLGDDNTCFYGCEALSFKETLSELINKLWQDLTEEERKQIKEILK